jgi:hypothetical protein
MQGAPTRREATELLELNIDSLSEDEFLQVLPLVTTSKVTELVQNFCFGRKITKLFDLVQAVPKKVRAGLACDLYSSKDTEAFLRIMDIVDSKGMFKMMQFWNVAVAQTCREEDKQRESIRQREAQQETAKQQEALHDLKRKRTDEPIDKLDLNIDQQLRKRQISEASTCIVCIDREKSVACMPCKHLCLCVECSKNLKICPLCRQEIQSTLELFV